MADERQSGVDIVELFSESLDIFRANAFRFAVASFVVVVLQSATGFLFIAGALLTGPMAMGLFKMALCGVRRQEVVLGDVFSGFDYFVQAVFLNLIILIPTIAIPALLAYIGLYVVTMLILLPAMFMAVPYLTGFFFLLDGAPNTFSALNAARELRGMERSGWRWVSALCVGLFLLGIMTAGVLMLFTLPIGLIALAIMYERYRLDGPGMVPPLAGATE